MAHLDFTQLEAQISRISSIRESIRVYIESVAHDIEDKKKEEAKLQELADKMRTELDATVNAIMQGTVVEPIIDNPDFDDPNKKDRFPNNPFSGQPGKLSRSLEGDRHLAGPAGEVVGTGVNDPRQVEETPEDREKREQQERDQQDPNVLRNNPVKSAIVPQDENLSRTFETQQREKMERAQAREQLEESTHEKIAREKHAAQSPTGPSGVQATPTQTVSPSQQAVVSTPPAKSATPTPTVAPTTQTAPPKKS